MFLGVTVKIALAQYCIYFNCCPWLLLITYKLILRYQRTPKGTILAKNIFFHFRINLSITFHLKKILRKKLDSLQSYRRKLVFALIIVY